MAKALESLEQDVFQCILMPPTLCVKFAELKEAMSALAKAKTEQVADNAFEEFVETQQQEEE